MPVTLNINEDASGVTVLNQETPPIVVSSATAPGPRGVSGQDGTDGSDANWAAYTQVEYDALLTPDPATLYVIIPA